MMEGTKFYILARDRALSLLGHEDFVVEEVMQECLQEVSFTIQQPQGKTLQSALDNTVSTPQHWACHLTLSIDHMD